MAAPGLPLNSIRLPVDGTLPRADADLDEIWYYTAKESGSVETADRFIDPITDRFYLLSDNPDIGRRRDEYLRPGLRSFNIGQYLIIYRIENEDVVILYVVRGSRNLEALLND
ncbi:MAG: plasmid stabilization system [Bryobacterales bacterium]|nr:plasmid stabilization system [Bryobacterales bacterium]